jgi:diacylglycerol kinase
MKRRSWANVFADALRGIREAVLGERAFYVHLPTACVVVIAGALFQVSTLEWVALALCIALVLALETMNSALERLAKAITRERNVHLGAALDMAAGAVLLASVGAAFCGLLIFLPHIWRWWSGK